MNPQLQQRIRCAEIFGGVTVTSLDLCTRGITASIHSTSSEGGRGGDIYYFSVCTTDKLTRVVLADMRGHGEEVSHLSEWLYMLLQDHMNSIDGSGLLSDLNRLCHAQGIEAITTAAVISYYLADRNLYYSYAGHPPVFVQERGEPWRPLAMPDDGRPVNLPLGVLPEAEFDQRSLPLQAGDRMLLYTDGVPDCPDSAGEPFGEDGLAAALHTNRAESLGDLREDVVRALATHAGGIPQHDDCTIMALEVREGLDD